MPGRWLLALARAVFDGAVVADVVQPTIADLQREWIDAVSIQERTMALMHGYVAYWSLLFIAPVAFASWPGRSKEPRFPVFSMLIGSVILIVLALRLDLSGFLALVMNRLPEGAMGAVGAGRTLAFLAGPMVLAWLIVRRWRAGSGAIRIRPTEIMLLGLLSVSLTSLLSTAGLIGMFEDIGSSGRAGVGIVTDGVVGATMPMVAALGTAVAFALVALLISRGGHKDSANLPALNTRAAVGFSVTLCLIVLAVDRLLATHHAILQNVLVGVLEPGRPGGGFAVLQAMERNFGLLIAGGVALTLLTIVGSLMVWHGTRSKLSHPLLRGLSRAVALVILAGGIWHGLTINADLDAFRESLARRQTSSQLR